MTPNVELIGDKLGVQILGDRDIVWWALETGFLDQPVEALADPAERLVANLQNSGRGGGHSLSYRTLRDLGVQLVGRFLGSVDGHLEFAPDLAASFATGVGALQFNQNTAQLVVMPSAPGEPAQVQVTPEADGRSRLTWIVDVLPHEIVPYMNAQMDQAALAMQKKLGRSAA